MPHQALELAAGATARLTGLDSATTLPDLSEDLGPTQIVSISNVEEKKNRKNKMKCID